MVPKWKASLPWDLINKAAHLYGQDPDLVAAIIMQESSGRADANRFEKGWKYFFFPRQYAERLGIDYVVEQHEQSTSWGLMQVMGSVAREHGMTARLSAALIDPATGIDYGCKHLRWLQMHKAHTEADLIASYNAGHPGRTKGGMYLNQRYVDGVDRYVRELRTLIT